jgi:hypothetical protein
MNIDFLAPVFEWINTTSLSKFLQESTYPFPVIEVIHLMGLTMLLGAQAAVCLRFLGWGMKRPASEIYEGLARWSWLGMAVVVSTGLAMVVAEPIKLSRNAAFPYKLTFIVLSAAIYFLGYLRLVKPGRAEAHPGLAKTVAIALQLSLFGAGVAGRSIGFV